MTKLLLQDECVRNDAPLVNRKNTGLLIGGVSLLALAAAINIRHAIGETSSPLDIAEAAALALAMSVGFVVLPGYGISKAKEGARLLAAGSFVGALICGGVSFTNLVGSAMKGRLTAAVEATDT